MNYFKDGVDASVLRRADTISVEEAVKAQYYLMPCIHKVRDAEDFSLHNFEIESNPLVATTPEGRSLLEDPNRVLEGVRTAFSGAGMGILEFIDGKKFILVNERDAGAPSFEFNMHFNGGMADAKTFAPGYTNVHPLAISACEFLEETAIYGPDGQISLRIPNCGLDWQIQENIAAHDHELLASQIWFREKPYSVNSLKIETSEFLPHLEKHIFVWWVGHDLSAFKAHCLMSVRTTNVDITKFYRILLPYKLEDIHIYSTEEIAPPNSPAFPLDQTIFLYELDANDKLTGWVAGMFKSGIYMQFSPKTIPIFRHKHTDPLKEALMIIGFNEQSLKEMGFRQKKIDDKNKIKSML